LNYPSVFSISPGRKSDILYHVLTKKQKNHKNSKSSQTHLDPFIRKKVDFLEQDIVADEAIFPCYSKKKKSYSFQQSMDCAIRITNKLFAKNFICAHSIFKMIIVNVLSSHAKTKCERA